MIDPPDNKNTSKSATINLMINKMSKSKSRLVRCLTDGMMSSNILVMTTNYKKLSRKKLVIRSKNLSRSQKIRIGGEPSGMSSI